LTKPLLFAAACATVLAGAAACTSGPLPARAALDCPATQGDLTRSSIAPDGKSCVYTTRDGDDVQLRLIPVSGSYQAALAPIEQELSANLLTDKEQAQAKVKEADDQAKSADASAKSAAGDAKGAAAAAKQAANDALGEAKDAESAAKDASDVDAVTRIDLPGIHINADEGGKADIDVGSIHVNAGDQGAVIRIDRPVRLRGEALSPEKRGFRATYIIANDNLKDGWRAVGYEAAGPKAGPITVAVVKSRSGEHDHVLNDVKRLVRKNGGV